MMSANNPPKVRRRRLLFAIDSLAGGGAERVLCEVASGLDVNRYDVQIALTQGNTMERFPSEHVPVVLLLDRIPADLMAGFNPKLKYLDLFTAGLLLLSLSRLSAPGRSRPSNVWSNMREYLTMACALGGLVQDWKPDCIISFLPNSNMISLLAKAWCGFDTPIICSDRNHLSSELPRFPWPQLRRRFIRRFYPKASAHIAVSTGVAADLHDNFGVSRARIRTIINGVDPARLDKLANAFVPPDHAPSVPRLLAVGRLSRQKGFDILLRALGRIRSLSWHLTILGNGEEEGTLRELTYQLGITERVDFSGWHPNPYPWIKHSDLLVMSSRWEGMPNVLLEAMAMGLPAVATDCPTGPRLLLDGGRVGRLVENGSESQLADAIAGLLAAPEERHRLGVLAKEHCRQYSINSMIDAYRELIDAVIAQP